ncbi:iron uptake porin [Prochlorococcus sp. MIT 1341]|uniref:iron uptake porin n=1 Tax=Prochlorococcus sp. MIT 1341 TaxID=3096221 RepID=UPI002A765E62|nr:iron uptake porin [Prochlorococcus sp. MIT 1341]
MKLFQQLLVAPAALGLMAPMAAQAADLNIDGVSDYSAAGEQVTSVSQFSDVYPTDWAYQALSSLTERYGCVAGYPGGTFGGNRSITRYEAAALLNACLDRVTEVSDDVKRLLSEFGPELAVLKGRVDGIEARVGDMAAGQFSTTTKLSGVATFVVGGNAFSGDDAYGKDWNDSNMDDSDPRHAKAGESDGAVSFNYDYKLSLDTSFTGEDLLKTRLRTGNFGSNAFSGSGYVQMAALEVANSNADAIKVDRLYYSFPWGDDFTVTVGPEVRQDDMLAVWPSAYPSDSVLDFFTYAGAPGAYNLANGGGAGISWNSGNFDVTATYISTNAESSNPHTGGVMTEGGGNASSLQIAYTQDSWGLAAAYANTASDNWNAAISGGKGTPLAATVDNIGETNSYALSGWWLPSESGLIPSVSAGWGMNTTDDNDDARGGGNHATYDSATSQSWYIGLEWADAFVDGNDLGFAFGQPTFVTDIDYDTTTRDDDAEDGNYALEWWYKIQVSDNITVTPAMFYLTRPYGDWTDGRQDTHGGDAGSKDSTFRNLGALVKTTFKF